VQAGDLVFDIGAHVGDHVAVFRGLGAGVVLSSRLVVGPCSCGGRYVR
jgi:hypothetical protein